MKGFRRGKNKGGRQKEPYRINDLIDANEVRVIDDEGAMLGVMTPAQALTIAEDRGLDLIEIAPNAKPPTCRIMDYGKWKYENKKKQAAAKKKQTIIQIKEVQVRPRTDQHDMNVKLKHARRFLLEGDKVKINLRFYGREMAHQELGVKVLENMSKTLDDIAVVEAPPKKEGRQMFVMLAPDPEKIKDYKKKIESGEIDPENPTAPKPEGEAAAEEASAAE